MPLHGTGQGSGDSGCRWVLITDALIKTYDKYSQKTIINNPHGTLEATTSVTAFIDDATLYFKSKTKEEADRIQTILEENATTWERTVHATGGKLNLSKCRTSIRLWKYDDEGKARMQTTEDQNRNY